MPLPAELSGYAGPTATHSVMVIGPEARDSEAVASVLRSGGFRAQVAGSPADLAASWRGNLPALVVATGGEAGAAPVTLDLARKLNIPVVVVVSERPADRPEGPWFADADDWVAADRLAQELVTRVAGVLKRRAQCMPTPRAVATSGPPLDVSFLALVIHDLRTPLNVIGLSLRMISQAVPKGDPELDEDLRFVEENFRLLERMLTQLSDYFRLYENLGTLTPIEFSPRRLVNEFLEGHSYKPGSKVGPVVLDVHEDCPEEVGLDPTKTRLALKYTLANVTAASNGAPIRLALRGDNGRWVIEFRLDQPPPLSVHSTELTPRKFERLCGFAAERRGMDLAIAARVSELFGGSARLEVEVGRGTTVVLDWPARLGE